ncbi:MAG TPA: GNAT family N-acetyltransferase [Solirubrobacteraceae bacterium]|nr:GNAT family N-acetyltransferase [Solirubrobacteraceae bacterium]
MQWIRDDGYAITTDRDRIDLDAVHAELAASYWSPGIARDTVERAIANSLPFSLLAPDGAQAGFARAITDRATYAYLADVYVAERHRGGGLGVWLVETVLAHPELQGLRRWALATADAHGLYARFGFAPPERPALHMFRE